MTCREFEQAAALLTLSELSPGQNMPLPEHADGCPQCGAWMQEQRLLAAGLQALRARTSSLEAGPDVERALLCTLRRGPSEATQQAAPRFAPIAGRLGRFFEVGAYAAVAAAIVVAMVLGVGIWRHRSAGQPVRSQSTPASIGPALPVTSAAISVAPGNVAALADQPTAKSAQHLSAARQSPSGIDEDQSTDSQSQTADEQDYMALMLCDPLSCSSDAQLVRMELPASPAAGRDSPQVADVVVGDDGVVRAVRIVN